MLKKRICHITSVHKHNDPRIFYKECLTLSVNDYEVHFISPDSPDGLTDNVFLHNVSNNYGFRLTRMTITVFLVFKKALQVNACVYHFHDPELIFAGLFLKFYGKKVIYDVHEDVPELILSRQYIPKLFKKSISCVINFLEKYISSKFDFIITATETIENKFKSYNKNTITLKNYLSLENIYQNHNYLSENYCFKLIFIGAIYNERGISEAVEALNILKELPIEFQLYGPVTDEYLNELYRLDVYKKIKYGGVLTYPEIFPTLRLASVGYICDLPVKRHMEGLPVKLFDYMASGLPVISSNFPMWAEIVEGNNCGICVDPKKPVELAKAIKFLYENPKVCEEMGRNGVKGVIEKYNWENESKKLLDVYAKIS